MQVSYHWHSIKVTSCSCVELKMLLLDGVLVDDPFKLTDLFCYFWMFVFSFHFSDILSEWQQQDSTCVVCMYNFASEGNHSRNFVLVGTFMRIVKKNRKNLVPPWYALCCSFFAQVTGPKSMTECYGLFCFLFFRNGFSKVDRVFRFPRAVCFHGGSNNLSHL